MTSGNVRVEFEAQSVEQSLTIVKAMQTLGAKEIGIDQSPFDEMWKVHGYLYGVDVIEIDGEGVY